MLKLIAKLFCIFLTGCTLAQKNNSNQSKGTIVSWPVENFETISRNFSKNHDGLDIVSKFRSPILAAHDGYVIYAGVGYTGYGKLIILDSSNGWATLYAHLDEILVKEKMLVSRGGVIGKMGNSGIVTGTHLHFELMHNKTVVDPKRYFPLYKSN